MPAHPETLADRQPNGKLIAARGRLQSPYHRGKAMSRAELADRVNGALDDLYSDRINVAALYVTDRWIGSLERGERRWTSAERRAALRRATGALTDHDLGLHKPRHAERGVSAEVLGRMARLESSELVGGRAGTVGGTGRHQARDVTKLVEIAPFRPADEAFVDMLEGSGSGWNSFSRITNALAEQRQAVAPEALLSLVEAHRECLATLFRQAGSDPLRIDIGVMMGEASIVASRLWSAQGVRSMALAHCSYARKLADKLNSRRLGATARIFESNLHSDASTLIDTGGDVMTGLRLLQEAAEVSECLTAPARARIAAEQAQTYAALQLRNESRLALDTARGAAAEINPEDCTGLYSDWGSHRLPVYEGTCHLLLNEPAKAVAILEAVIEKLGGNRENINVVLAATVDLASSYADLGELEQSCVVLGDAYDQLQQIGNHRGIARARAARQRLARWDAEPAVRQLDSRMAAA